MRSMKLFVVAAVASASLFACGPAGQPRIFRVAVDVSPVKTLNDPQCFRGNMPNLNQVTQEQNFRAEAIWVVWDAAESKQYLDMGSTTSFTLGNSPEIKIDNLIEGTANAFSATRQESDIGTIREMKTTTVVTAFNDLNATPTGTVVLDAKYQCQDGNQQCPQNPAFRSCHAQLNFWARKIEVTQSTGYSSEGTSIKASTN
jgi:hypothetical protein